MNCCVFGAASNDIAPEYIAEAEALGEVLARRGHNLVFGGGASGLMGAAARGFRRGNGHIIGVAPSFFQVDGVLYPQCDELVYTETMRERKAIMEEKADAFVVLPGGIGTFEEFLEVFTLRQLGRHCKPIVLYNIRGFYDKMRELLRHTADEGFLKQINLDHLISFCDTKEEVIREVEVPPTEDFEVSFYRGIRQ